jgi:hypothetical protein
MKLIAFCTSMIPFSMVNTVDTSLTSYAKKFPALHAKEIFFDDTKKEYAIGARTRREVDVRLNPLFRYILAVNTKPDPITKFLLKDKGFKMRH